MIREGSNFKDNNRKNRLVKIGSLLFILGFLVFSSKYIYNYFLLKNEEYLIKSFFEEQQEINNEVNFDDNIEYQNKKNYKNKIKKTNYFAVIKIPKINLEKGLCDKNTNCNNVNKNILVLNESDMPDKEKGNFILAGHSGSGRNAYFKNLYKLNIDDEISVFYNSNEYKYKMVNQYEIENKGIVNIVRNKDKTILTLITCSKDTKKQTIIICELIE